MLSIFFATKPFAQKITATGVKSGGQRHPTADEANRPRAMSGEKTGEPQKVLQTPSGGTAGHLKKMQPRAQWSAKIFSYIA